MYVIPLSAKGGVVRDRIERQQAVTKRLFLIGALAFALLPLDASAYREGAAAQKPVRAAVIGGMTMTPLWGEIQKRFEVRTGIKIEVVVTGEKPMLARVMKEGRVDFLTMHSSDASTNLVADGWARDLRPWAKNDLVIVGPVGDPAGISGLKGFPEPGRNWHLSVRYRF